MLTRITRVGMAGVLGASLLVAGGAALPSQAKTVKACVKKSTGEVRILTGKKKCKKGWKKISWNQKGKTGPQGDQGAQGPNLTVRDATGKVLGTFLGILPEGPSVIFVKIDGGLYTYLSSGVLYPLAPDSPRFKTNTCTGTAYVTSSSALQTQFLTGSAGGPSRIVWRKTAPPIGPTSAWELTTTTENAVAVQLYKFDGTGACVADGGAYNGTLIALKSVTAPPDVPGPLTVG